MAMDPPGEAAAKRAGALGRRGHGDDGDSVGCGQDLHDRQTCWDQRRKTVGQRGKSDLWMCQSHVAPGRATSYPTAPEARLNPNRDPPPHETCLPGRRSGPFPLQARAGSDEMPTATLSQPRSVLQEYTRGSNGRL
jgi:hypothetical protein